MKILYVCLFLGLSAIALGQNYTGCSGTENLNTVVNVAPTLLTSTTNGKKYIIQDPNVSDYYSFLAVVTGTPYEMGYALGTVMQEEVQGFVTMTIDFIYSLGGYWVGVTPQWMQEWELSSDSIIQMGLHMEEIATAHYTPQRFFDELRGISDAANVSFTQLLQSNLFPELTRAICSIVGAWGPATPNGNLYHLRALDYLASAPFNNVSTVTVYLPTEDGAQHHANFGWPGMIGSLAGYNGNVGIGERVWANSDDEIATIFGEPWMFVLRDVIQFGTNLEDSIAIMENANRTCNIYVGLGSRPDNSFRGFQYAGTELIMYTDQNWSAPFSSWHPQMDGVIFWDKGEDNACIGSILQANYGNITPALLYQQVVALRQTGDTIVAVFSYDTNEVWFAFASNLLPAYNNPMIYLNMTEIFATTFSDNENVAQ
jgi:isopenicillin-N N-acyltransferase-like protein